jgi:hypothetical protein
MGLRAGLDVMEKCKYLTLPGLELRSLFRPARSLFASPAPEVSNIIKYENNC